MKTHIERYSSTQYLVSQELVDRLEMLLCALEETYASEDTVSETTATKLLMAYRGVSSLI